MDKKGCISSMSYTMMIYIISALRREQFGYIMSTKTKLIHSQRTRSTQGGFQKLTMSLPCQHLSNLPVADLLFSSPCMSSDLIELDPFSGAKEIPLEYNVQGAAINGTLNIPFLRKRDKIDYGCNKPSGSTTRVHIPT